MGKSFLRGGMEREMQDGGQGGRGGGGPLGEGGQEAGRGGRYLLPW